MNDALIFNAVRRLKQRWTRKQAGLTQAEVDELNAVLKAAREDAPTPHAPRPSDGLGSVKGPLVALLGTIAATSLLASVPEEEGVRLAAYRDIAGIPTICAGDTKNVRMGMVETEEGCQRRLEAQLIAHARPTLACTPRLTEPGRDWQRAAAVSLAYNIGVGAWCRSTADKRFDVGDWKGGCDAFLSWNKARVNGQLRPVLGLTRRRNREREICLRGVA